MERIDITEILKTSEEPRGFSPKHWGHDNKNILIKYNCSVCKDSDIMESLASTIFNALNIDTVNVRLGHDFRMENEESKCCIIDSFLVNDADISINLLNNRWSKADTGNEQKNISSCFCKMFNIFSNLMGIDQPCLEEMKTKYIRMIFGDCVIDNEDRRLKNIEAIYNEKTFNYRLAPAFDNALAFNAFNIGATDGYCYVGNQEFEIEEILTYITKHHYYAVEDIVQNLDF